MHRAVDAEIQVPIGESPTLIQRLRALKSVWQGKRAITFTRRIVQTICFAILLYGAFIWTPVEVPMLKIPSGTPRTTLYEPGRILWVSGRESIIELYVPFLACRFIARGGVFRSCTVHFISENATWLTPLIFWLPHIVLFIALVVLAGRFWCAWVCPLGAITDFMTWLRKSVGLPAVTCSRNLNNFLGHVRNFLLFGAIVISVLIAFPILGRTGVNDALFLIYCQFCPARLIYPPLGGVMPCWYDATSHLTMFISVLGWIFLGIFFVSFAIPRFWCRICAIGALVAFFNRGALLTLEKNHQKCTSCGACERCCPMDVERVFREREKRLVTDARCILCLTCVEKCPEPNCLEVKLAGCRVVKS